MIQALLLALAPVPEVPAPTFVPPAPAVQDDDAIQDKREEIKALVTELTDHVKAKGEEDEAAVQVVDKLIQEWERCGPKDRTSIVKALDKCMAAKRRDLEGDVPDNRLYLPCAVALREMSPESVKTLEKWIGHKQHRDNIPLQTRLILSLGYTKEPSAHKKLVKLLDDDKPAIQAAASEALGEYADAELKLRKDGFEEMLKILMALKGIVDTDPADTIARERYDIISPPIITSMQRLSGQDIHGPDEWQRWWNKNKKTDWDEGDS